MLRPLAVGLVLGAFAWPWLQPGLAAAGAAAMGIALVATASGRAWLQAVAMAAAGLALGMALVARIEPGPQISGTWRVRGQVVTSPQGRSADVAVAAGAPVGDPLRPLRGRIRVRFPELAPPAGSVVALSGRAIGIDPTFLPGEPDPVIDAARAGVRTLLLADAAARLGREPPAPDFSLARNGGLLLALVTGDSRDIPEPVADLLRRTGTWHLISVSGLHVGLGAMVGWALGWLAGRPLVWHWPHGGLRWLCAAGAVAGAAFYADLASWGVPARRAVWMVAAGSVVLAASRRPEGSRLLALAAIGVLVADPTAVGTLGFQLSFGAMLGMIGWGPRCLRWVPPDAPSAVRWVTGALAASLGATLGTLPVVALHFQSLSPASPLANLWAVPWIGSVATPCAVAAAFMPGALGEFALALADAAAQIGIAGIARLDVSPWAPAVSVLGAVGLGTAFLLTRREVLAVTLALGILGLRSGSSRELVVSFLSVGQGDAALVEWPDGRRWLVDGGPPGDALLHYLRRRGIDRLDTVFLSHAHPDHYGGLVPVLEALRVDHLVAERLPPELVPAADTRVTADQGAVLRASVGRTDEEENDRSLALSFGLGAVRFLLPGDAEESEEEALAAADCSGLQAAVLKLAHHGSKTSTTAPFLDCVRPRIAVASAGFDNRYRHPSFSVLRALIEAGVAELFVTARDGTVQVRTDGQSLRSRALGRPAAWRLR